MGTNAILSDIPVLKEVYQSLPVTFFEVDNEKDLCDKLLDNGTEMNLGDVRSQIDSAFSIKDEVNKILQCI